MLSYSPSNLVCVDNWGVEEELTVGKEYDVVSHHSVGFVAIAARIKNNLGVEKNYSLPRFEKGLDKIYLGM